MGCKNSSEQSKAEPVASNRGANPAAEIQTVKPSNASQSSGAGSARPLADQPQKKAESRTDAGQTIALHYFDLQGRGEIFRMIFTHLKLQYTDHRVRFDEWAQVKTSPLCEFQQLPVLEINGKKLCQTRAILRYVCQRFNLYPHRSNLKDIYMIESVCDLIDDLRSPLITGIFGKDAETVARLYAGQIKEMLPKLEARLAKNPVKSGFFVGPTVSMADFAVFEFLWDYFLADGKKQDHEPEVLQHALLGQFAQKMQRLSPELSNYLNSRPANWL